MKNEKGIYIDNILNIFNTKGNDKNFWELFFNDINSNNEITNKNITSKLNQCIWENQDLQLALDIIDFIIDYGTDSLITEISSDFFLNNYNHILSSDYKCDIEMKKLALFLLQKWSEKKTDFNFKKYYMKLVNDIKSLSQIIGFPSKYNIVTYLKYISGNEISGFIKNSKNNNIQNIKKTVYQNPFSDETKNSTKLENISIKAYVNEEEAPPQFSDIISDISDINNMNLNNGSVKIYDSSFFNNKNPNAYSNKESIKILDSRFNNNNINNEENKIINNNENKIRNNNIDNNMGCPSIIHPTPELNADSFNLDYYIQNQKNQNNFDELQNFSKISEKAKLFSSPKEPINNNNKNENQKINSSLKESIISNNIEKPKIYSSPKESIISNNNQKPKIYSSPKESTNNNNNQKPKIYSSPKESTNSNNNQKPKIYTSPKESLNINNIKEKPNNYISPKEAVNNVNNEFKAYDKQGGDTKKPEGTPNQIENKDNNIGHRGIIENTPKFVNQFCKQEQNNQLIKNNINNKYPIYDPALINNKNPKYENSNNNINYKNNNIYPKNNQKDINKNQQNNKNQDNSNKSEKCTNPGDNNNNFNKNFIPQNNNQNNNNLNSGNNKFGQTNRGNYNENNNQSGNNSNSFSFSQINEGNNNQGNNPNDFNNKNNNQFDNNRNNNNNFNNYGGNNNSNYNQNNNINNNYPNLNNFNRNNINTFNFSQNNKGNNNQIYNNNNNYQYNKGNNYQNYNYNNTNNINNQNYYGNNSRGNNNNQNNNNNYYNNNNNIHCFNNNNFNNNHYKADFNPYNNNQNYYPNFGNNQNYENTNQNKKINGPKRNKYSCDKNNINYNNFYTNPQKRSVSKDNFNNWNNPNNNFNCNFNNNNNNFFINNTNNFDIYNYKSTILSRIKKCNEWINQGKYSFYNCYKGCLENEIKIIQNEISKCNNLINTYKQTNDLNKLEIVQKLKGDIEDTISKYNQLNGFKEKPTQLFTSEFDEYYNKLNNSDIRPEIKGNESNFYDKRQIFKK